jgi:hypothetical protein
VLDLRNTNQNRETNFLEIVLNLWRSKLFFLYIFIPLLLVSFLLESIISKKNIIKIKLKDPIRINSDLYPSKITKVVLSENNLKFKNDDLYSVNYYINFFEPMFLSKILLKDFVKINNEKYNFYEYIDKNNITVKKERDNYYVLILPKNDLNKTFFKDYLDYVASISLKDFKNEMGDIQKRKIKHIDKFIENVDKIFENSPRDEATISSYNTIKFLNNLEKTHANRNMLFFNDNKSFYNENWILETIELRNKNENYFIFAKFVLPLVLSLIIHLLFILIKLKTRDQQN